MPKPRLIVPAPKRAIPDWPKKGGISIFCRYADILPRGSTSVSYLVRATIRGTFTMPPASAMLVNEPEVMGMSAGGAFLVSAELAKEPQIQTVMRIPGVDGGQISLMLYGDEPTQARQRSFFSAMLSGTSRSAQKHLRMPVISCV